MQNLGGGGGGWDDNQSTQQQREDAGKLLRSIKKDTGIIGN